MTRVVVDDIGRFVGYAYTGTVLDPGQKIVDMSPDDIDRLNAGARWDSLQETMDRLRSWRENPRARAVLGLQRNLTEPETLEAVQFLIRVCDLLARDVITLYRLAIDGTSPGLIIDSDPHAGPGGAQ